MSTILRHPVLWLATALLLLTFLGTVLLNFDACVTLSARDRAAYGLLPLWQASFDALSATCGVGLLTYDLQADYTPVGRWILLALGLSGALLFIAAARPATIMLLRLPPSLAPTTRFLLGAFLLAQVAAAAVALAVERLLQTSSSAPSTVWHSCATLGSLGWRYGPAGMGQTWLLAGIAFVAALGWPVWYGCWVSAARRLVLKAAVAYALFLILMALLAAISESPRGQHPHATPGAGPALLPIPMRISRSLAMIAAASGAGTPTEYLADQPPSETTKACLATVVFVGGISGGPAGGLSWLVTFHALTACTVWFRTRRNRSSAVAALACAGTLLIFVAIATLGLMLIETLTTTGFQHPPTLGDALLDATSAVCGANLSTGLTARVTSPNLSSGIRHSVDAYQYGMLWLMLAMFIGRILPLLVLTRLLRQTATT